ncbi:integral component of membrane [Sergentomyia squamirostris]
MSISASTLLGLFASGILFRNVNGKGARTGAFVGLLVVGSLILGGLDNKPEPTLLLRTDGCDSQYSELNFTSFQNSSISESENKNSSEDSFWLFRISFVYYGLIGLSVNLMVSYLASLLTGGNVIIDERLLAPFLRKPIKRFRTNQELNMQKENLIR